MGTSDNKPFELKNTWEDITYFVVLEEEVEISEIKEALMVVVETINRQPFRTETHKHNFDIGKIEIREIQEDDQIWIGTTGTKPSANMVLLADNKPFESSKKVPAGTKLSFLHVKWKGYGEVDDLPLLESLYRSLRRTFAGHLEIQFRLRNF